MSATEQVQELRQRLTEATSWAAHCRGEAQAAADRLIAQPSVELVQARDHAASLIEVADLEVARVEKALRAAEVAAHEEALALLGAEHGPAQAEIGEIWSAIEGAVGTLESSCTRGAALRREAQKRTGRAREHHAAAGLPDEERPSFMIALPRSSALRGRLGKVIEQLQRLEIPNW